MPAFCRFAITMLLIGLLLTGSRAGDTPTSSAAVTLQVEAAIRRAIPLLENGSAESAQQKACFTCHSQALPVMALADLKQRGFVIDHANLRKQLDHTVAHLKRGQANYLKGTGQGGKALTAGYALWTLEAGDHTPDETTDSVVDYLLQYQRDKAHWSHPGSRPPSSGSDFTVTYVALRGLEVFGADSRRAEIEARQKNTLSWLIDATPKDTEDRVFRLLSLLQSGAEESVIAQAVKELSATQLEDGGWPQTATMQSDAYATATALFALLQAREAVSSDAARRGIEWLLRDQQDDGSWHVVTRAKAFQP